jgi:hypothetical protein
MLDEDFLGCANGDEVHLFVPEEQFPIVAVKEVQGTLFESDMDGRRRVFQQFTQALVHASHDTKMDRYEQ